MQSKEIFLLDIGNTNTTYGLYTSNEFSYVRYIKSKLVLNLILSLIKKKYIIAISCVIPEITNEIIDKRVFLVNCDNKMSVDLSLVKAIELGADRIANLEALSRVDNLPAMVIDCGTAITIEVLNENKVFLGGIIGPGRYIMRKALNSYTKLLPIVPIHNSYFYNINGMKDKDNIDISFGRDTIDSIILGSDIGLVGIIKEYIRLTKKILNIDNINIYITGGDKDIITSHIPGAQLLPDYFTLLGIYYLWEKNNI